LASAVDWIAQDNPLAARAFRDAVLAVAERIGDHPQIGARRLHLARSQYRFLVLTGYPYLVVYRDDRVPPVVVRVVHGARDLPRVLRDLQ
jgi:toxin ParE1/3/4